jgi:hypothetical protein
VFTDLYALEPHTAARLFIHKAGDVVVHVACGRFTAQCRENANIGQASATELLQSGSLGIIFGHQKRMIEHLLEPSPDWLEASEVEAPVALIELVRCEHELESQGIAMHEITM